MIYWLMGKGEPFNNISEAMQKSYNEGITDEFIKPIAMVNEAGEPLAKIKEGDVVIFFNFRTDRRQRTYSGAKSKRFS